MNILNWVLGFLGLLVLIIPAIPINENKKTVGEKAKFYSLLFFGVCIMICSVFNGCHQNSIENQNQRDKTILNKNISKIQTTLNTKNISDLIFEKWLRDSIGVIRSNNKPIIYNTNIFISKAKTLDRPLVNEDSSNIIVERINKDSITIYPKHGMWIKPIIGFDVKYNSRLTINTNGVEDYGNNAENFKINGIDKKFILWKIYTTPTVSNKFILNDTMYRKQIIIFGDQANSNKIYAYYNDKIKWIPQ